MAASKDDDRDALPWQDPSRPIIGNRQDDDESIDERYGAATAPPPWDDRDAPPRADRPPPSRTGSSPDPVLFGPDPFADLPGGSDGTGESEEELPTRPTWPVVVTILLLVAAIVGVLGIWIL